MGVVSRFVGAVEAARQLGVQRATLYAYVSRGLVERRTAIDGRTSLYAVDDLDLLATRSRRREPASRPSLDVQISSAVTVLDEAGPRYRGRDVAELARTATYEQVAELLWTGALPARVDWPAPAPADVRAAQQAAAPLRSPLHQLIVATLVLGTRHPDDTAPALARRLLALVPDVLAGRRAVASSDPRLAARLAAAWDPDAGPALASALKRALVVLADHELTTSTLAVRLAASVRAAPAEALVAGLSVTAGPLHGSAANAVHALLADCARNGVGETVARRLGAGERLPGFGHKIYAGDDPRLTPLREAIALLPDRDGRSDLVDDVIAEAGKRLMVRPNVDLGLGALTFVAGLPATVPHFAVARIAGLVAHYEEELGERPVRFRGIARPAG